MVYVASLKRGESFAFARPRPRKHGTDSLIINLLEAADYHDRL